MAKTSNASIEITNDRLRPVRIWLYVVAVLVLMMVAVGGLTRLTDSGLSITSWKPISGMLPPLSTSDWQAEFDAYKHIPEYVNQNHWMSLEDFKSIFWWEWTHRFLGRVIGIAFFIPFVVFLAQRRLDKRLASPLAVLFLLGGFQGFLGWWMVSSGLSERVDVSQYRLAAHLGAACLLFLALIWVARRITPYRLKPDAQKPRAWPVLIGALGLLLYIQLIAGAFVAGTDAGFGFNTWPLMEGAWIPDGLFTIDPAWLNFFENLLTIQFTHRMIAYCVVIYVGFLIWFGRGQGGFKGVSSWLPRIATLVALQVVLGISTLLAVVPVSLALGHQALAFMLLGAVVAYLADMLPNARYNNTATSSRDK